MCFNMCIAVVGWGCAQHLQLCVYNSNVGVNFACSMCLIGPKAWYVVTKCTEPFVVRTADDLGSTQGLVGLWVVETMSHQRRLLQTRAAFAKVGCDVHMCAAKCSNDAKIPALATHSLSSLSFLNRQVLSAQYGAHWSGGALWSGRRTGRRRTQEEEDLCTASLNAPYSSAVP
jgi:hypothetical protein